MNPRFMAFAMLISLLIFPNQLHADVNVLIIGSTHSFRKEERVASCMKSPSTPPQSPPISYWNTDEYE